jgi:hypothetical protein
MPNPGPVERGGPWRSPGKESADLYPGLVVHDDRVSGSITVGKSRLPLWAFAGWDWDEVVSGWDYIESEYKWTHDKNAMFLHNLLEMRGEFGRLLLILADAERRDRSFATAWWDKKKDRKRVATQLRRCLAVVEDD